MNATPKLRVDIEMPNQKMHIAMEMQTFSKDVYQKLKRYMTHL